MEQGLKQRLVGAGVIVALGIVFIPMLLDGAGERQLHRIPPSPQAKQVLKPGFIKEKSIPVPANRKPGQIVLRLPDEPASRPPERKTVKQTQPTAKKVIVKKQQKTPVKTIATKKTVITPKRVSPVIKPVKQVPPPSVLTNKKKSVTPVAADPAATWVVQVGSFTDAKKAFNLRDRLRKKKYNGFVDAVKGRTGRKLYRVRVGPVPKREKAQLLSEKLKSEGNSVFVTRHH